MKRVVLAIAVAGLLVPAAQLVFGKGHVPVKRAQVCHRGRVIEVSENAVSGHQTHRDGQLPACDKNNIFFTGDACPADGDGDGFADLANPRATALTEACPPGKF